MSIRAFRFQLRTRPAAERTLRRFAGSLRWVWNAAIAEQRRRREAGEKFAGHAAMCKWLTAWRHAPETAWLAEAPIHPLQQTLRRLEAAFQRFFAGQGGYPRFKRRGQEPGLRFPDPKQFALDADHARVKLPKLEWLRMRQSRPVAGVLRNASVTTERGRWFVSLQVQLLDVLPSADVRPTLGIDLGVALFAATSDGRRVAPLDALRRQQRRLHHAQRAVPRKVKGSRNRRKAVGRLGRLHARIAAQRRDWLHKLSTELADAHPVIAIEDLKVAACRPAPPARSMRRASGCARRPDSTAPSWIKAGPSSDASSNTSAQRGAGPWCPCPRPTRARRAAPAATSAPTAAGRRRSLPARPADTPTTRTSMPRRTFWPRDTRSGLQGPPMPVEGRSDAVRRVSARSAQPR